MPPKKANPKIPAQIPGIDLASKQDDTDDVVKIFEQTDKEDTFKAAQDAGHKNENDATTAGVSTGIDLVVIDDVDDDVAGSQECRSDIKEDVIQVETIQDDEEDVNQVEIVPDETPIKTENTDPTTHIPAPTQAPAASYTEVAARTASEEQDETKGSYVNCEGKRQSARQSHLPQPS